MEERNYNKEELVELGATFISCEELRMKGVNIALLFGYILCSQTLEASEMLQRAGYVVADTDTLLWPNIFPFGSIAIVPKRD
jgi:hypothetical protein